MNLDVLKTIDLFYKFLYTYTKWVSLCKIDCHIKYISKSSASIFTSHDFTYHASTDCDSVGIPCFRSYASSSSLTLANFTLVSISASRQFSIDFAKNELIHITFNDFILPVVPCIHRRTI